MLTGPEAWLPGRGRRAGSGTPPPPRGGKLAGAGRTSGVCKNLPPGEPLETDSKMLHSFPYLPLSKISCSSYSEMEYGSNLPQRMVTQRKRSPDPKYFSFGQRPKVALFCLFGYSRALLGDKNPNPTPRQLWLSAPCERLRCRELLAPWAGPPGCAPPHPGRKQQPTERPRPQQGLSGRAGVLRRPEKGPSLHSGTPTPRPMPNE